MATAVAVGSLISNAISAYITTSGISALAAAPTELDSDEQLSIYQTLTSFPSFNGAYVGYPDGTYVGYQFDGDSQTLFYRPAGDEDDMGYDVYNVDESGMGVQHE